MSASELQRAADRTRADWAEANDESIEDRALTEAMTAVLEAAASSFNTLPPQLAARLLTVACLINASAS